MVVNRWKDINSNFLIMRSLKGLKSQYFLTVERGGSTCRFER